LNGLPGVIGIDPPYQAASLKVRNGTDYDDGGESWGVSSWATLGLDQVQCALGMDRTGPVEIRTEDRETKDAPDFPLAGNPSFSHLLNRKPVVMKFANGTQVELSEPGKNSHSQLGGIFVGEKARSKSSGAISPPIRRISATTLPQCCLRVRARTFRTSKTLSSA
jgi:hypothetical protein